MVLVFVADNRVRYEIIGGSKVDTFSEDFVIFQRETYVIATLTFLQ